MRDRINIENRLCFLNTGIITPNNLFRRTWESNIEHGFVTAGHNVERGKQIKRLKVNDIIAAFISTYGFVGIGKVLEEAVPIRNFNPTGENLRGKPYINENLFDNLDDELLTEQGVKIQWIKTTSQTQSHSVEGRRFHIYPGVCCTLQKQRPKQLEIIKFIEESFDIELHF